MKMFVREIVLLTIAATPMVYLATIYNDMPAQVPVHFGIDGVADGWGPRASLWWLEGGLNLFIYLIFLVVPALDPKKKIAQMGNKYHMLRFVFSCFFALLSIYLLNVIQAGNHLNPRILVVFFGALLIVLGNYMQTVRPNYFIGLRTPWTLESEEVWRRTHRLSGKLMMAGGVISILAAWFVSAPALLMGVFFTSIGVAILLPALMSFILFRRLHGGQKR